MRGRSLVSRSACLIRTTPVDAFRTPAVGGRKTKVARSRQWRLFLWMVVVVVDMLVVVVGRTVVVVVGEIVVVVVEPASAARWSRKPAPNAVGVPL